MTKYAVSIKACLFELQESKELIPEKFEQLYQFHRSDHQVELNENNKNGLWQCFADICQSLKQVKKYYDQAVKLIEQDPSMNLICEDAIGYLDKHYGRNSVHKVVYHSQDQNSIKLAIHQLMDDVKTWEIRSVISKRSILYTFFDLAEDPADGFAGRTEEHYLLAQGSEYNPTYFYHQWQQSRRLQLFRCAVQDDDLKGLVLQLVKLIDERNMNLGSESDLRYFSDQEQLFDAPYIALIENSDEHIVDFIDSYSLTYRWYNHLPEINLVDRILNLYPQSPYLRYFYPATGHRMSGNESYCPPFSDWYLSQLSDTKFLEEQLLICASDVIRAEQVCYTSKSFLTIKDMRVDEDFYQLLQGCIDNFKQSEHQVEELDEDELGFCFQGEFYDRLALALMGEDLSLNSAACYFSKRHELRLRVANNILGIIDGRIEPAFDVCYGYSSFQELRESEEKARVTEPLFSLRNIDSFALVNYQGIPYLLSESENEVVITEADTMTPISFRAVSEEGLYGVAYALQPEVGSPAHFATLDHKQGILQGWHLGQSLPVLTLRLNAFQNSLPFLLSDNGQTLLIGITKEIDQDSGVRPSVLDISVAGKDTVVAIDLSTSLELCRFENDPSQTLKLSPDGKFAIYTQEIGLDCTGRFIYIDLSTGAEKAIRLPHSCETGSSEFAISSDSKNIVYKQSVIALTSGQCLAMFPGDAYTYQYEFSQCDEYVINTISEDNVRDIYRVSTGERVARLYGSDGPIFSQNYLDAESGILYSFDDYDINLYDLGKELSLSRAPLAAPEYRACRVTDTEIHPEIIRRKGSFSNDEHGTKLDLIGFGVEDSQNRWVQPKCYKSADDIPNVGINFVVKTRGIRSVQGFIVKLHHPSIEGKTLTEWQAIGKNEHELVLRDPFTSEQRVEGVYEFEIYSLDQKLMFARQMIHIGVVKPQYCQIHVQSFGSYFGNYHPVDKKEAINYDDTSIGFHLLVNCEDKQALVKLNSRISREEGCENDHDDRRFKHVEVQKEWTVVDGQTIELVIFGKESNAYLSGRWRFELLDAYTDEVLFQDTITVYEQDRHMTESPTLHLDLVDYGIYRPTGDFGYEQRRVKNPNEALLMEKTHDLPKKVGLMYGYKFKVSQSSPDAVYRICIEQWASGQRWIGSEDGNDRYKTHWTTIHKDQLKMASWTIAAEHEIFDQQSRIIVRHGSNTVVMMHDFYAMREEMA